MGRKGVFEESSQLGIALFLLSLTEQSFLKSHLFRIEVKSDNSGCSGPAVPPVLWEDKTVVSERLVNSLSSSLL